MSLFTIASIAGAFQTNDATLLAAVMAILAAGRTKMATIKRQWSRRQRDGCWYTTIWSAPTRARSRNSNGKTLFRDGDDMFRPHPIGRRNFMSGEVWGAVGAIVSAAIVALAGPALAAKIRERQDGKISKVVVEGLENSVAIFEALEQFGQHGAARSILWASHNCGGVPGFGSPYYTTAVHRHLDHGHRDVTPSYKNLEVDKAYIMMLLAPMQRPFHASQLIPSKMKPSLLKDIYIAEGISNSLIIGLGFKGLDFFYLSIDRYEGVFTDEQITFCELQARNVWALVKGETIGGGAKP